MMEGLIVIIHGDNIEKTKMHTFVECHDVLRQQVDTYVVIRQITTHSLRITANVDGASTSIISSPITAEEKAQKKNDVKARSILLMGLSNKHLLTFSQYKDTKTLFNTIQARFGDLETMSFVDLYNNFKIVEQEVKRTVVLSSSSGSSYMAFLASPSSTNEVDIVSIQVSTASTPLALMSKRARRYFQRTGKKITINGSDTAGYDKTKVECFNFHKMGHFVRECISPRSQENMVAIDGASFDWSYMGDDEVPTNIALMDFSNSERIYIIALTLQLEKLKKEKESNQIKIKNFENASKTLDKLIGSQITDNSKTGLGFTSYNAVAPPPTGLFVPATIDLSSSGLEEFKKPEFESYAPKDSKSIRVDTSNVIKKVFNALVIKDWISNCDEDESEEVVVKSKNVQHKP
uniref:Uncharacterized protein n=1 Tax=Tanacetum cinerariifolium TaxID=118510 RepID=A0A6L2LA70_TANCI|nr:hypothetical protein [Tanacetum cinerariifolium]